MSWSKETRSEEDKKMCLGEPRIVRIFEWIEGERGRKSGKRRMQMAGQCVDDI